MSAILTPGMANDRVGGLQQLLAGLGYYDGRVDSIYGARTKGAVSDLQRQLGVPVSGTVDIDTALALQRWLAVQKPGGA